MPALRSCNIKYKNRHIHFDCTIFVMNLVKYQQHCNIHKNVYRWTADASLRSQTVVSKHLPSRPYTCTLFFCDSFLANDKFPFDNYVPR